MSDINIVDCKYTLLLRNGGSYFADTLWGLFTEIMKPTEAGAATLEDVGLKKPKVEKKSTGGMVINKRKLRKPKGVGRALRGYGRALR